MLNPARFLQGLIGAILLMACAASPARAADWNTLSGHVPKITSSLTPLGGVEADKPLRLAIGLPLRDGAGVQAFLAQLYDPASPGYRQFLTGQEFTARFGPTASDYEAVKRFAASNGLAVACEFSNRLVLDVTGPAGAVERAFRVKLLVYRHPTEARNFYAPDREPTVAAGLPIVDVQGLSDLPRPKPHFARKNTASARPHPHSGSAPDHSGDYFGDDFRNAYAPDVLLTGAGQQVGLFEADGFYAKDISNYAVAAQGGRTNIILSTVLIDGFKGKAVSSDGNLEVSLDIEMAMSIAPGLSQIVVFEGDPNNYMPNDILNSMLGYSATVKNLSSSWGWNGGPSSTTDTIFTNMAAVGQSFFNASGDTDAFTAGFDSENGVDNPNTENAPSSSPIITQVGATTLSNYAGAYAGETVWNWGVEDGASYDGEGSSGGVSSYYPLPGWQSGVRGLVAAGGSTNYRNIPDVAANGDNVYVAYDNGRTSDDIGGTSCAAPIWAGFLALVNQQATANGKTAIGFANPALYGIGEGPGYNSCFHDITSGNNTWSGSPNLFYAETGYDLCTGWGSPSGEALIVALAGSGALGITPVSGTASGYAGGPLVATNPSFQLTNTTGSPLTWTLGGIPAWLSFSSTNGLLPADSEITIAVSFTAAASNLTLGTYIANLMFSNSTAAASVAAQYILLLNQPLSVSPASGFTASGPAGGPFNITSQVFSLTNAGASPLAWGIGSTGSWLSASPSSGMLAPGGVTNVTISLSAGADSLAGGDYSANLTVTNGYGIAATLSFAIGVGQSLVNNGGFETGDFTGWTLNGSTVDNLVTSVSSYVHSGNYGAALGQAGSLAYLSQSLATTPGQNYLLSLWMENPPTSKGATPNEFLVQWNGATLFDDLDIPFTSWTNLQFIVSASAASSVLQIGAQDDPSYLGLDDVTVIPLPLPQVNITQSVAPAMINLTWSAVAGLSYQVQFSTNPAQGNWINLGTPQTAGTTTLSYSDSASPGTYPQGFYRLILAQ